MKKTLFISLLSECGRNIKKKNAMIPMLFRKFMWIIIIFLGWDKKKLWNCSTYFVTKEAKLCIFYFILLCTFSVFLFSVLSFTLFSFSMICMTYYLWTTFVPHDFVQHSYCICNLWTASNKQSKQLVSVEMS